jgi:hypothetical protein
VRDQTHFGGAQEEENALHGASYFGAGMCEVGLETLEVLTQLQALFNKKVTTDSR